MFSSKAGAGSREERASRQQSGARFRFWTSVDPSARSQILYWAFLGYALSDPTLPKARQQAVLDELVRIATS